MRQTVSSIFLFLLVFQLFCSALQAQNRQVDSLKTAVREASDDSSAIALSLMLTRTYFRFDADSAGAYIKRAIRIAGDNPSRPIVRLKAQAYLHGAQLQATLYNNRDSALQLCNLASEQFESIDDKLGMAAAYGNTGLIFESYGKWNEAIEKYEQVIEVFREAGNKEAVLKGYANLGNAHRYTGNFTLSAEILEEGINLARKQNNPDLEVTMLHNLGVTRHLSGDSALAIEAFQKAVDGGQKLKDWYQVTRSQMSIGGVHLDNHNSELALEYYRKVDVLLNEYDHPDLRVSNILNRGVAHLRMGNLEKAEKVLKEACVEAEAFGDPIVWSSSLLELGQTMLQQKRPKEALKVILKGQEVGEGVQTQQDKSEAYRYLSIAYRENGMYENALKFAEEASRLEDSLYTVEQTRIRTEMATRFESERKQQQIEAQQEKIEAQQAWEETQNRLLYFLSGSLILVGILALVVLRNYRIKNRLNLELVAKNQQVISQKEEIESQSEMLEAVNRGKDRLFSIISHDLRSPLTTMQGLLNLAKDGGLSPENYQAMVGELSKRFEYTSEMLDNLLFWSRNQLEGIVVKPVRVDVTELVSKKEMLYSRQLREKKLTFQLNTSESVYVEADSDMTDLVLRNLISNAIKFAPEEGMVDVRVEQQGDRVAISIGESGDSMPVKKFALILEGKYYTTLGTAREKGTGLGLQVSVDFVKIQGGELRLTPDAQGKYRFSFSLPVAPRES